MDTANYLHYVEARIAEESERVEHYLHLDTKRPLIAAVQKELLSDHAGILLEKGLSICIIFLTS